MDSSVPLLHRDPSDLGSSILSWIWHSRGMHPQLTLQRVVLNLIYVQSQVSYTRMWWEGTREWKVCIPPQVRKSICLDYIHVTELARSLYWRNEWLRSFFEPGEAHKPAKIKNATNICPIQNKVFILIALFNLLLMLPRSILANLAHKR